MSYEKPSYIDNVQDLLLKQHLLESKPTDEVAILARARTLTALQELDSDRKGVLLDFLYEAHLIGYYDCVHCTDTNKLRNSIINLYHANLSYAWLGTGTMRGGGGLVCADLSGANLSGADLWGADLSGNLSSAILIRAILIRADLSEAFLSEATLSNANQNGADLSDANLRGANLRGAIVTQEQLAKAKSLQGATMPDGSKHP